MGYHHIDAVEERNSYNRAQDRDRNTAQTKRRNEQAEHRGRDHYPGCESEHGIEPALGLLEEEEQTRTAIQPLMPPRNAHLAMLIAAGLINNQILEANGRSLLIKGTASKVIDRFEEEVEKGIKITERERIVTQINAFDLKTGE
jgi:hypothetical protein